MSGETKEGSPMFDIKLVRDGTWKASQDCGHALQDESIPPVSSLKALVRSQKRRMSGTFGQRCEVKTNHFVVSLPENELHQYDVCIRPEVRSCGVNRAVMEELVSVHRQPDLNGCLPAYDGRKCLYTAAPLPFICRTFEIELEEVNIGGDGQAPLRRKRKFEVIIKFVTRVGLQTLVMALPEGQEGRTQVVCPVLDIILHEMFIERYSPFAKALQLGEGLEIRESFYKSLQFTQKGFLLNIDVSSTVSIQPIPVMDYIAPLLDRDTLDSPLCNGDLSKIKKALEGLMVQVHIGAMLTTFRIFGLTKKVIKELPAPVDDHGPMVTFLSYFEDKYGYKIRYADLPCLQVGNKQRAIFMPMEVCKIAGQRYSKQLNRKQMSTLLQEVRLHPLEREQRILQTASYNCNEELYEKEFGIKIKNQLLSLDARVLPPPWLKFHDSGMTIELLPQVGYWNMVRKRMFNGGRVSNWTCVNFSWDVEDQIVRSFCHELAVVCQASGMDFSVDPGLPVVSASPEHVEWTLRSYHQDAMNMLGPKGKKLDLLIVILPNNNGSLYGSIKRICDTEIGVVSQCCLAKHVLNMRKQYLANVALKVNVKVGGRNTVLVDALTRRLPCVGDVPTIIFGAHVMHPGKSTGPSIAAVVASQDWPEVTNYAALAGAQANGQELIQDLFQVPNDCETRAIAGGMIKEHLISFRRTTGLKPQRIIYYRDAVCNEQVYQVMWQELVAIKKACSYLEPDYKPSITYVVLQKHRHTRFFADNENDESCTGSGNVLPGTVVDSDICHPNEFGFYLCSQVGTKGMTRPVYYHILWDENRFTADAFQCLTNYLCYIYARCTHPVSLVPPVYYARLMARRGQLYMEQTSPETEDAGHAPSPSDSEVSGNGALGSAVAWRLPVVMDNVKRGMFYC